MRVSVTHKIKCLPIFLYSKFCLCHCYILASLYYYATLLKFHLNIVRNLKKKYLDDDRIAKNIL